MDEWWINPDEWWFLKDESEHLSRFFAKLQSITQQGNCEKRH